MPATSTPDRRIATTPGQLALKELLAERRRRGEFGMGAEIGLFRSFQAGVEHESPASVKARINRFLDTVHGKNYALHFDQTVNPYE